MNKPPEVPNPPNHEEMRTLVREAVAGVDISARELTGVLQFFIEEARPLFSGQRTFFVMGSYDKYPLRRLRIVENQLNRRMFTYAFLLCDLLDPHEIEDVEHFPWTRVKFFLVMQYVMYAVFVFEGRHAGPSIELGETIENESFFEKSFVFQRVYETLSQDDIEASEPEIDVSNPYSLVQTERFTMFQRAGRLFQWELVSELVRAIEHLP